jgi:anti-anti-sigma regulatory factor
MLRITAISQNGATRLVVEGKLAGACVKEFEKCWHEAIGGKAPQSILVDLSGVTFVDAAGKQLLTEIRKRGSKFAAEGLLARCLIQEISGAGSDEQVELRETGK